MSKKLITSLTPEQEAKLPSYREKWLKNGLRTDPIPFETAVTECRWIYKQFLSAYSPEPLVFLARSPWEALLIANWATRSMKEKPVKLRGQLDGQLDGQLRGQLGDQLRGQLDGQFDGQLGGQFDGQLGDQLRDQLDGQLGGQLDGQLDGQLGDQLRGQLDGQLRGQLRGQLDGQLGGQLDGQLGDQLRDQLDGQLGGQLDGQLDGQLGDQLRGQLDGQFDGQLRGQLDGQLGDQLGEKRLEYFSYTAQAWWWAGYYCFYDFVLEELLPEKKPGFALFDRWRQCMERINWIVPLKGLCIAVQRPTEIHYGAARTQRGPWSGMELSIPQLHREGAAAVKFSDGWSVHALYGTRVPAWAAETPIDSITKEQILGEKNADVQRAVIRRMGMERVAAILDYQKLDAFDEYELVSIDIGDKRVRPHLKMTCPSTKQVHIEGVSPGITKAAEGLAFKFKQAKWKRPIWEDSEQRDLPFAGFDLGDVVARHGDVMLKKTNRPVDRTKVALKEIVLHKGTNNNHSIKGSFYLNEEGGKKFVGLLGPSELLHPEHGIRGPMKVDPALIEHTELEVDIQLLYDHMAEEARQVVD